MTACLSGVEYSKYHEDEDRIKMEEKKYVCVRVCVSLYVCAHACMLACLCVALGCGGGGGLFQEEGARQVGWEE